jgi:hypoxia up-regulated 1
VPETDLDEETQKTEKKEKVKKPLAKDQSTIPLEIEIVYNAQGPMNAAAKRAARDR